MMIYLDDIRETPEGYVRTYTVEQTIELIENFNGNIEKLSLDNDLGIGFKEGREVMKWIEEKAFNNELLPIPHIIIHSGNPVAQDEMMTARYNAWKYWQNHGYSRYDWLTKNYN